MAPEGTSEQAWVLVSVTGTSLAVCVCSLNGSPAGVNLGGTQGSAHRLEWGGLYLLAQRTGCATVLDTGEAPS